MTQEDKDALKKITSSPYRKCEAYPTAWGLYFRYGEVLISEPDDDGSIPVNYKLYVFCNDPNDENQIPERDRTAEKPWVPVTVATDEPAYAPLKRLYDISRVRWEQDKAELAELLELLK